MKVALLVEDSKDDELIMRAACRRAGIPHLLQVVNNGESAIDYLSGEGIYVNRTEYPLPDIIFLDIGLPKRSGHDVLEWIRAQPAYRHLPVAMLTSSSSPKDVTRAYSLGVTSYIRKASDLPEFGQAVRVVLKNWLEINVPHPSGDSA